MSKYEWVTTLLRRIELSERLLDESVSKNPLNSTSYSFLTNNTQHWVKELAKALDMNNVKDFLDFQLLRERFASRLRIRIVVPSAQQKLQKVSGRGKFYTFYSSGMSNMS